MIYILRFVTTISHIKTLARASLSLIQYGFEATSLVLQHLLTVYCIISGTKGT